MMADPPFPIAQELQSFILKARFERGRGNQPLGWGSLVPGKDEQGETIAAPFIWNLSIEPSPRHIGRQYHFQEKKPFQPLSFNRF